MKWMNSWASGLAIAVLALGAQAAEPLVPGQKLPADQIAAYGELPVYAVGKQRYRLLPQAGADGASLLLDAQGTVLGSKNEVLITGASEAEIRASTGPGPAPVSIQYFQATGIALVRYADFPTTVAALEPLRQRLPSASVRLAISHGAARAY
ncbi:hypothetical protein [Parapusillimonas granuli]|uniref:Uncharacterized protein n=1 Tax=Parapusillimonas granuli TaxID=380911 RepID=A0A853FZZ8_9BURK|nr:hypothetical protein [Parapusillimonas granuli]MBB5215676.1 hypothetical protein [Parapusillimonas granuli]NYT49657.1 hypothetical protein [Parapusillimonas granuli]